MVVRNEHQDQLANLECLALSDAEAHAYQVVAHSLGLKMKGAYQGNVAASLLEVAILVVVAILEVVSSLGD